MSGIWADDREPGLAQQRHRPADPRVIQDDVGIDEHQHIAGGRLGKPLAGPGLAQPPRWRLALAADDPDARVVSDGCLHHCGGVVRGGVVQDQQLVELLPAQRSEAWFHAVGLIAQRE